MKKILKEHDLVKLVFFVLALIVLFSWLIPAGSYSTGVYVESGKMGEGLGLLHLFYGFPYAIGSYFIPIAYLVFVGIFYGIVNDTEMYKTLVSRIAKKVNKKHCEVLFGLGVSLIVALLASVLNNTIALFILMPFLVAILRKAGFNKISTFACTFGSLLVGVLGATVGSEGLGDFVQQLSYGGSEITLTTEIVVRIGILLLTYVLFSFFNAVTIKKNFSEKKEQAEEMDEAFVVGETKKRSNVWPIALVLFVLFVFLVLGFTSWEEAFGIEIFTDLHTNMMDWTIGEFAPYAALLGDSTGSMLNIPNVAQPFGSWYLFNYSIIIAIATVVVALAAKIKWNEFFTKAWEGIKKIGKPVALITLAYVSLILIDFLPFFPTVVNAIAGITKNAFNPFVATLQAFILSIFHSDLAYIGYSLYPYLVSFTGTNGNIVFIIYLTIYGLIQFVTPISVSLLFGLSYMKIPYKKWFSYIWKFFVGMLVCLVVIFALLTYI